MYQYYLEKKMLQDKEVLVVGGKILSNKDVKRCLPVDRNETINPTR